MRLGYGWPRLYSTAEHTPGSVRGRVGADAGQVISIEDLVTHVVVVFQESLQLWSGGQHRVRLDCFHHSKDVLEAEGCNVAAASVPSTLQLAVLTSKWHVHLYRAQATPEALLPVALAHVVPAVRPLELVLTQSIVVPRSRGSPTAIVADPQVLMLAYDSGWMSAHSWTGHSKGWINFFQDDFYLQQHPVACTHITQVVYSPATKIMLAVLQDGTALSFQAMEEGLAAIGDFEVTRRLSSPRGKITCAAIGPQAQTLALGCDDGVTRLYELYGNGAFLRDLSLDDWGYDVKATGAVVQTVWTPESQALAVGYAESGFVVWTPSGCRLMSSLRPASARIDGDATVSAAGGVAALAWGQEGLRLLVAERECTTQLVELSFVKPASVCSHLQAAGVYMGAGVRCEEVHVLHGDDRLVLVTEAVDVENDPNLHSRLLQAGEQAEDANDLAVTHVLLPHSYIATSWPIRHVAVSSDGLDIAAAGSRGLALYSRRNERWRLFGDVCQERMFSVTQVGWVTSAVAACCAVCDPKQAGVHELVLYPRHHLDASSVLARRRLPDRPECMDCRQSHILLAYLPLTIHLMRVKYEGKTTKLGMATASLVLVRELLMVSVARPLTTIGIVTNLYIEESPREAFSMPNKRTSTDAVHSLPSMSPRASYKSGQTRADQLGVDGSSRALTASVDDLPSLDPMEPPTPTHCVLLRWGGLLSLLDMETGCETRLLQGVECLWLSDSLPEPNGNSAPWLTSKTWLYDDGDGPSSPFRMQSMPTAFTPNGRASSNALSKDGPARRTPFDAVPPPRRTSSDVFGASIGPGARGSSNSLNFAGGASLQSNADSAAALNAAMEMPWWVYGANGVKLLCPGALSEPISSRLLSSNSSQGSVLGTLDHELEFDREVLPIGVSLSDASIIGATQRLVRGAAGGKDERPRPHAYCLQPIPQSQPVLPCLLRRMLQRGSLKEARLLAAHHQAGPHFLRSLEWLLFTTLELQFAEMRANVAAGLSEESATLSSSSLLTTTADLIRSFPAFADVVVSVSRKTDVEMWPLLFSAVGRPSALLKHLLSSSAVHSASCLLVVVDTVEGAAAAHEHAIALIEAALTRFLTDLCAELLRFLYPPYDVGPDDVFVEPQGSILSGTSTQRSALLAESAARELPASPGVQSPSAAAFAAAAAPFPLPPLRIQRHLSESLSIAAKPPQQAVGTSWFSYLLGNVGVDQESKLDNQSQAATDSGLAHAFSVEPESKWSTELPPLQALAVQDEAPREPSGARRREGPHSADAVMRAGSIIASHAWQWLSMGHLHKLAELACALAQVPCSLAGIMQKFPSESHSQLSAASVIAALRIICEQFPDLHSDPSHLSAAHDLLLLFYSVGAPSWRLAMAVSLNQQSQLQHFRQRMPKHWQEVRTAVAADEHLPAHVRANASL